MLMKDADIGTVSLQGLSLLRCRRWPVGLSARPCAFLGGLIVGHSTLRRGALDRA